ncbi:hypothetical protein BX600DRAFT_224859 [Xylariales sp. PMI_506]|nr:hypothetical protein BX600DRAFT_224859 [Xylariales sp. PMI_506]
MMDDHANTAGSPAPSPVKGRGGFNKRGGNSGRGNVRRTARKTIARRGGGRGRGRGRNKTYDHPRVQAAYERSKELRELYSDVTAAMKPALEKLADQTLNQMIENRDAHKQVPEYRVVQNELDDRLGDAIDRADLERATRKIMTNNQFDLLNEASQRRYLDGFEYVTDEFYDGILNKLTILEELRREDYGTEIPATMYTYRDEPDEVAKDQGPYVFFRNGIEVPYPSLLEDYKTSSMRSTLGRKPRAGPKRKADDLPDGLPNSKKGSSALTGAVSGQSDNKLDGGDTSTPRPRHIGGLLSARAEQDGDPESNAPSPTPIEEGLSPESEPKSEASSKKDVPDLPGGASEPDQRGVRVVYRRGHKANNRLIIPPLFEFDKDDIGFRDSTNDSTRKATRTTRGKFLNSPNSGHWHLDQTIFNYNCLDYNDGELDPELVKKFNVHPKYGFFLPDSVNESEVPSDHVDGTRPVVVVTPNGSTLHASRSVRVKVMDDALKNDRRRGRMTTMLDSVIEKSDLTVDDITTEQMRRREREALERLLSEPEDEDDTLMEDIYTMEARFGDAETDLHRHDGAAQILEAAAQIDEAERFQTSVSSQRASRPYDAVRDIFSDSEPSAPQPPQFVNTSGLSVLADICDNPEAYPSPMEAGYGESSPILDPRGGPGLRQAPAAASNAFLQTALNPTPAFAPIAPAPPQNADGREQTPGQRNPFTGQGLSRSGSPGLPPLRPTRRDKLPTAAMEGPSPHPSQPSPLITQPQPSVPSMQEYDSSRGIMQTNAGSFYPPASHRSYHHAYSPQEPSPIMPMPLQQSPTMSGPTLIHNQPPPPPPPQHMAPFPAMSPPMPGQAQLAPMPPRMGPSPPIPSQEGSRAPGPPGSIVMVNSSPDPASRHRNSISSNGQNAGKYRKIAAAPIPHNRLWQSNGGSELRLSNYDPKGAIKDYMANEPPPRSGPTTIRGWSVSNGQKRGSRGGPKKEGSVEDTESPK